jgi:CheY-like chemotaxis protein
MRFRDTSCLEKAGIKINCVAIDRNIAGPRILVVEDEPIGLKVMALWLSRLGYDRRYEIATDAKKALEFLPKGYDLIITDLGLPDVHGLDFIKAVREKDVQIPIIICTAYMANDEFVLEAVEAAGCKYIFEKPPRPKLLEMAIKACLEGEK